MAEQAVKASEVKVGDTIQHPAKRWTARKVLAIEPVGDWQGELIALRFRVPSIWQDRTTAVTFPPDGTVLVSD